MASRHFYPSKTMSLFVVLGLVGFFYFVSFFIETATSYANSADSDQTPRFVASDLGLHCLTILFDARHKWVRYTLVVFS